MKINCEFEEKDLKELARQVAEILEETRKSSAPANTILLHLSDDDLSGLREVVKYAHTVPDAIVGALSDKLGKENCARWWRIHRALQSLADLLPWRKF